MSFDILALIFTRGQFWPLAIVLACVCLCVCVRVCTNPLLVCAITQHPFNSLVLNQIW